MLAFRRRQSSRYWPAEGALSGGWLHEPRPSLHRKGYSRNSTGSGSQAALNLAHETRFSKASSAGFAAEFDGAGPNESHYRLSQAFDLVQQGQFSAAVDTTKSLVDSGALQGVELGRAWALLGFAYKEQGEFAAAHRALDESIHILGHNPISSKTMRQPSVSKLL